MTSSSCEAEYVAVSYAACQVLWIEMLLDELKVMESKKMKLFIDNKSNIDLFNHLICYGKSKHIERRYHIFRDQVNKGKIELEYCKYEIQLVYLLTKALKKTRFNYLKTLVGIRSLESKNKECFFCISNVSN